VIVLFERGRFDAFDSIATASALAAYATGLPAYVLIRVLAPGFFAREDTVTPVRIAAAAMAANIVLNLILMQFFAHVGIALASSLAAWLNAVLLWWFLRKRGFLEMDVRLRSRLPRLFLSVVLMAAVLAAGNHLLDGFWGAAGIVRIGALAALIAAGLLSFGLFVQVTRAAHIGDLKSMMRKGSG
jgi:putative peptidoglycan lipid II flippase